MVDLANTTENAILNNFKWDQSHFSHAIEAIATGYVDNKKAIENYKVDIDRFKYMFELFQAYLKEIYPSSPFNALISKHTL